MLYNVKLLMASNGFTTDKKQLKNKTIKDNFQYIDTLHCNILAMERNIN